MLCWVCVLFLFVVKCCCCIVCLFGFWMCVVLKHVWFVLCYIYVYKYVCFVGCYNFVFVLIWLLIVCVSPCFVVVYHALSVLCHVLSMGACLLDAFLFNVGVGLFAWFGLCVLYAFYVYHVLYVLFLPINWLFFVGWFKFVFRWFDMPLFLLLFLLLPDLVCCRWV